MNYGQTQNPYTPINGAEANDNSPFFTAGEGTHDPNFHQTDEKTTNLNTQEIEWPAEYLPDYKGIGDTAIKNSADLNISPDNPIPTHLGSIESTEVPSFATQDPSENEGTNLSVMQEHNQEVQKTITNTDHHAQESMNQSAVVSEDIKVGDRLNSAGVKAIDQAINNINNSDFAGFYDQFRGTGGMSEKYSDDIRGGKSSHE